MKYSIITVNYNNKDGLRATIESVVSQTFRDFEFIVIDGGMSKAYQSVTGIAGYTLIYSSNEMALSCHDPFVPVQEAISSEVDLHSTNQVVFKPDQRLRVSDIDIGEEIRGKIKDLKKLLMAYREGTIKQSGK